MVKIVEEEGTVMILHTPIISRHTIHHRMDKAIMVTCQGTGCLSSDQVLQPLRVNLMFQLFKPTVATILVTVQQPALTR